MEGLHASNKPGETTKSAEVPASSSTPINAAARPKGLVAADWFVARPGASAVLLSLPGTLLSGVTEKSTRSLPDFTGGLCNPSRGLPCREAHHHKLQVQVKHHMQAYWHNPHPVLPGEAVEDSHKGTHASYPILFLRAALCPLACTKTNCARSKYHRHHRFLSLLIFFMLLVLHQGPKPY